MPFINDMIESFKEQSIRQTLGDGPTSPDVPTRVAVTRFTFNVDQVVQHLCTHIIGQDEAIDAIAAALRLVRADIVDPSRPLYIAMLLGPTGVGKTEVVRLLAEAIHGHRESFCRVDMNTLSQEHYAASLTGAPPGYVGSKEGYTIIDKDKVEGSFNAPGIILFDEIEKASHTVIQTLLNVFDNGIMTVASGQETISFRNALVFMTSNIGARELYDLFWNRNNFRSRFSKTPDRKRTRSVIQRKLEEKFAPEFLNRIDDILTFHWLDQHMMGEIVKMEIERLNRRLRERHRCTIHVDDSLTVHLSKAGFDQKYGARALKRAVRKYVEIPLADFLLQRNWNPDMPVESITVAWENHRTVFTSNPVSGG
ncbi:MAG: AAA family ATPase [Alicyclobacillus macrosporangiidus]|uniref:AAA family ATPase n=1 Tax=Alicyclobacillus macrosporangiidus TaxID=392015 RepID=UPI0026F029BE|nr:AAA family ATPase [Alicyclobacillus macrosporangiidus]MCL6598496.1 AAA family ATPase [Alicyclobacillus macrosporangiidus]